MRSKHETLIGVRRTRTDDVEDGVTFVSNIMGRINPRSIDVNTGGWIFLWQG